MMAKITGPGSVTGDIVQVSPDMSYLGNRLVALVNFGIDFRGMSHVLVKYRSV